MFHPKGSGTEADGKINAVERNTLHVYLNNTAVVVILTKAVSCHVCFREIGTIVYSLGCFPTQKDLHDLIAEVRTVSSYFS